MSSPVDAAPGSYQADPNTVFLFHFDGPAGGNIATNSAALFAGTNLVAFNGNPYAGDNTNQPTLTTLLGAPGFAGFGNCANVSNANYGFGLDANLSGGFRMDDGGPVSPDRLPTHVFFGSGNTFTLEALVKVASITSGNQEIISTDQADGNADRGLQFRITGTGSLEFNFVGVLVSSVTATIPTNGAHAFVAGEWFHTALVYDGTNALFYWTRLSSGATNANLIGGPLAEGVDIADDMLLVIGNEGRVVGATGATEGLLGQIDEVRISNVARSSNEFVFRNLSIAAATGTQVPNYPENTLDGSLATRWSAQGDGQSITYDLGRIETVESVDLAFYQPAGIRTNWFDILLSNDNLAWRPALTNASGTNAPLANFDFADWPARFIRYVGHLNSVNDFNSLTEIVIHRSPLVDTDNDALPDLWESFYFGNLTNVLSGDPEGDLMSNAYEFLHGTDPSVFSSSGDNDADGLDDFWEMANLSTLAYGAYDDPDGDGYNNLAEMIAGTLPLINSSKPAWVSPRVAFLRDTVVTNNACLMPNTATYGRAINGISFQNNNVLLTFNGHQYTAWYDTVGTVQTVWLARRAVTNASVGAWEKFNTGSEFLNGDESSWDAHNVIAIGVCPADGTLHLSWDHHNNTLRYRRSIVGLCTTNKAAWGAGMLNAEQNWLVTSGQTVTDVTYPQFTITPTGGLMLNRRIGSSGNGDQLFYNYLPISGGTGGNWTASTLFLGRTGNYNGEVDRNAYINGLDFGPDGRLHVTWTWRETASSANHDICYAYSTNSGVTWLNNTGTLIADTTLGQSINLNSAGIIIKPLNMQQLIINQQAQCVDNDGRVHTLMLHRREEPAYAYPNFTTAPYSTLATAYYHYFRDPVTGDWAQRRLPVDAYPVGSRPKIGYDTSGNVYAAYISYTNGTAVTPGIGSGKLVIASASKASQFTDWEVVQVNDTAFYGEPLLDQVRLLADNILSVYIQENSVTTTVVGTSLHVFEFVVGVKVSDPVAIQFLAQDSLVTFTATAGHTYQLQSASVLAPASWNYVGPLVNGVNGLMALSDPNGRSATQRFYRVIQDP